VKPEQAKALREPFKPEQIGLLPKPTKKDNPKGKCSVCNGYHGLPAVHLDYVGHAATTDRLLQVDPEWTWEPMARGENGEPLMTNGGLWIHLTVAGVTRPGFGDGASMKEVIGDAIRNAAMRFGVALDLWAKEDLRGDEAMQQDGEAVRGGPASPARAPSNPDRVPAPASNFKAPEAATAAVEARDMTPATDTSKKKLRALGAKLIGEGKANQGQLDSAMIKEYRKSWEPALSDPVIPKAVVDGLLARLGRLDKNAEKAQQEVAA
jgi:hypothetical protein